MNELHFTLPTLILYSMFGQLNYVLLQPHSSSTEDCQERARAILEAYHPQNFKAAFIKFNTLNDRAHLLLSIQPLL